MGTPETRQRESLLLLSNESPIRTCSRSTLPPTMRLFYHGDRPGMPTIPFKDRTNQSRGSLFES